MNIPDIINGSFEAFGSVAIASNIYKLYQDKLVRGVYWPASLFWATWGYWNIYYYRHLSQWFSLFAGATLAVMTTIWLCMAIYYVKVQHHE